jgi:two-component system response regulator YesN
MLDAREYMDFHFHEEGCLKEVIEKSGLGVRRFRDLFHDAFRMTPNQYIITRKIEHAKGLLSAGGLTISEIALLCGFADVYYFSKVFKKETGITPSKWK